MKLLFRYACPMPEQLDPLATTALWTASMRAREHDRPDRLFSDPLASVLAGQEGSEVMRGFESDVQKGVEDPALAIRTRFLDDALARIAEDENVRQIVLVAAGMDSRSFRMEWPPDTSMYELDQPALLSLKERLLSAVDAVPKCRRIPIAVDLTAAWSPSLLSTDFHPTRSTVWLVEGLFHFLDRGQRDTLLRQITALSSQGSWLLADYVSQQSLNAPSMRAWLQGMAKRNHAWRSGCDDPESWLKDLGWHATVTHYGEPDADFGRWAAAEVAPGVPGTRGRYLIVASRSLSADNP